MDPIVTRTDVRSAETAANREHHAALLADFRAKMAEARLGGGAKYQQRQRELGKLPVRDRIERLLDPGSPFLELSPMAAHGL